MRARAGFVPQILLVPAVLGLALLVLPLLALIGRVDWSTLWADVTAPEALSALGLSLSTGLVATGVCVLLGVPLALVIARSTPRMAGVLRALVTVPLALYGRNKMQDVGTAVPEKTIESVKEDLAWLKHQTS